MDRRHNWSHMLVLFPDSSSITPVLSVEERLSNIERTLSDHLAFGQTQQTSLRSFEESMSARMDRLEDLVMQVLSAVGSLRKAEGQ